MSGREPRKLLILVVDRDDDLSRKTGIHTPVVGFEENLKAAEALMLADPEEADANAMFGALKLYRELSEKYGRENVEVATLAGEEGEGIEADTKIMAELRKVLEKFPADGCVFVSDGVTDQFILPLITSEVPVVSVRRLVVRQSESVEQTWLILGRYLRLLFTEPRYSKMFLGVPGLLMSIIGILYILNIASLPLILTAIGVFLFLRGFNIDQRIMNSFKGLVTLFHMPAYKQLRAFAAFISFILFTIGLYVGYVTTINAVYATFPEVPDPVTHTWWWLDKSAFLAGHFISGSIDLLAVGFLVIIISNAVYYIFSRDQRFWIMVRASILSLWLWALLKRTGIILITGAAGTLEDPQVVLLILVAILGVITMTFTILITRILGRMYSKYFRKRP